MMDVAVPANQHVGLVQEEIARRGWAMSPTDALELLGKPDVVLIDLREPREREKHGTSPDRSMHLILTSRRMSALVECSMSLRLRQGRSPDLQAHGPIVGVLALPRRRCGPPRWPTRSETASCETTLPVALLLAVFVLPCFTAVESKSARAGGAHEKAGVLCRFRLRARLPRCRVGAESAAPNWILGQHFRKSADSSGVAQRLARERLDRRQESDCRVSLCRNPGSHGNS